MTRAFLVVLVTAVVAASIWIGNRAPAGLLPSPRRPFQSYGNPLVRTETPGYPRYATGADEVRVRIDRPARRIVSQNAHADDYLYAVVPAERVVGVSETAYDRRFSNVYEQVAHYHPIVANDPERVLLTHPDLVITAESVRAEVPDLLRQAGVPVYRMHSMFETLASIEDHLRLIGYLTGEDERAEAEIVRFRAAISQAAARRPSGTTAPRVLGLGLGGGYSYGSRTLFNDILRVLGAENVAATHGLVGYDRASDERIVRWNPDWIVTSADPGMAERARATLLARPSVAETDAARLGHIVVLDNRVFLPLSPFASALVERLSIALYGNGTRDAFEISSPVRVRSVRLQADRAQVRLKPDTTYDPANPLVVSASRGAQDERHALNGLMHTR